MCLQILFQYSSISVALGFFCHWKMFWVKWRPAGTGKSNIQLLPGQPLTLIVYKTPDWWLWWRSELSSSSPSVGSAPQPLPPPERWCQWATISAALCKLELFWVSEDSDTFSKKSWLISNVLILETEKNPLTYMSSNAWRAPSPQAGLHLCQG